MIKTIRTHYEETYGDLGLEKTINKIGYENILNILSCYCGNGEYFYTIIYKENKEELEHGK